MRAAYIESYGQVPSITDLPEPESELPVASVVAAGINPVDLMVAGGEYYAIRPKPPYTPGLEGVARRDDGSLVYFSRPGDLKHGALAERVVLDPEQCFELPAGTDPATAIGCGIAGLAGYLSVVGAGGLEAGEHVVVTGATGAAGRVAVQVAKLLGAAKVTAIGRSEAGLARVQELGADEVVRFTGPLYYHEVELKERGEPHELTIDFTWGAPAMAALNAMAPGGRLVQVGNAASLGVGLSATQLRAKHLTIQGYSVWNESLERRREAFGELLEHVAAGRIQLDPEEIGLEDVPDAWQRQERSPGAKLVVRAE